jgi:DNA-binding response OmpR family regulator
MAGINGFELAKRVKSISPGMHIMFMTAYVTDDDLSAEFSLIKTDDVIQKPLKIKEICESIKARLLAGAS